MAVTDVPLTLGVAVVAGAVVAGRIELAGLAAGLATSIKYPGVFLLVPLVVAGWSRWRRLAVGSGWRSSASARRARSSSSTRARRGADAYRVQRLAHEGWLGFEHDHVAPIAFLGQLWDGVGPGC